MLNDMNALSEKHAVRGAFALRLRRHVINVHRVDPDQKRALLGEILDSIRGKERGRVTVLTGTEAPVPPGMEQHRLLADVAVEEDARRDATGSQIVEMEDLGRQIDKRCE